MLIKVISLSFDTAYGGFNDDVIRESSSHKKRLQQFKIEDEFLENYESLETRKTYTQAINYFLKFIITFYPNALDITDIERKMIIHYRNHIKEFTGPDGNLMAPNTVSLRLVAISSYFVYLIEKRSFET